jgi:NTP pyrophosphatase (non-canonical NTP hydrolase)
MMRQFDSIELWQDAIWGWATERNLIDGSTIDGQLGKLAEEMQELRDAIAKHDSKETQDAIGDMVVVLTVICEKLDLSLRHCMSAAFDEIKDRKGRMVDGQFVKEVTE